MTEVPVWGPGLMGKEVSLEAGRRGGVRPGAGRGALTDRSLGPPFVDLLPPVNLIGPQRILPTSSCYGWRRVLHQRGPIQIHHEPPMSF